VPRLLLAGAYPGDPDPDEHQAKLHALLDAGIRMFVNLMEEDETNYAGEPFVAYQELAEQLCPDVRCYRHAIPDLSAPTPALMTAILDATFPAVAGLGRLGRFLEAHRVSPHLFHEGRVELSERATGSSALGVCRRPADRRPPRGTRTEIAG